jgi:mannose-6-phosphate isomerase
LIAEVQQNSNTTYRLYDYDRKNPDGTSRPLHIERALDSINFARATGNGLTQGIRVEQNPCCSVRYMVADPHFCIQIVNVNGCMESAPDGRSFHALIVTSGNGELSWNGGHFEIRAGESVLIPAGLERYRINGSVEILKSFIGDIEQDIIEPLKAAGFSHDEISSKIAGLK